MINPPQADVRPEVTGSYPKMAAFQDASGKRIPEAQWLTCTGIPWLDHQHIGWQPWQPVTNDAAKTRSRHMDIVYTHGSQ